MWSHFTKKNKGFIVFYIPYIRLVKKLTLINPGQISA